MMLVSPAGLAAIQRHEGLRLDAYQDSAGVWTIGYGSTRYTDGTPVKQGDMLASKSAADVLFRETLREYESAVSRAVLVPLSQPQFDALVSLAYNIGTQAFSGSTLLKRLNAHDYAAAANEFLRWNRAGDQVLDGLRRRREAERAMFLSDTRPNDAFAGLDVSPISAPNLSAADKPAKLGITPMAPVLAALLPTLVSLIPELGKLFGSGSEVSTRNIKGLEIAAEKAAEIVVAATGSQNLQAAVETMQADPSARKAASDAVQAEWYQLSPGDGGGVTGARTALQSAISQPGWAGIAAAANQLAMDVAIVGGGGYILWAVVSHPSTSSDIRSLIIGSIAGYIAAVVQFRYGSSVSSRAKDAALAQMQR